jgi:MFS family permease
MERPPTIRSLTATVYLPTFLFAVGQGAVIPIVALAARDVGASVPVAGLIVALRGIGTMLFDVPAGQLVGRLGERKAMVVGTGLLLVSLGGAVVATSPPIFGAFMFIMGWGWSMWLLARLTYVSEVMPIQLRGRALSTLGGVNRIGNFVGPFLGALAITQMGIDGAYYVHIVLLTLGLAVLLLIRDPHGRAEVGGHTPTGVGTIIKDHSSVFLTAGVAATCISVLRSSRHAVIPLWAEQVGVDAAGVAVIFGISSALDMTLFYPAGMISDSFGRKRVAVPCLTLMATGFLLLPLTDSFVTIILVGLLIGFGNGLGSGIVMTLGADFAPEGARAAFLGVWRMVSDVGQAGGPLVAAAVAGVATLGAASLSVGALGLAGAAVMLFTVPEPLHRSNLRQ